MFPSFEDWIIVARWRVWIAADLDDASARKEYGSIKKFFEEGNPVFQVGWLNRFTRLHTQTLEKAATLDPAGFCKPGTCPDCGEPLQPDGTCECDLIPF